MTGPVDIDELTLADLDADEALGDAVTALYGDTRAKFLCRAAFGGAAMLAALAAPPEAAAKVSDIGILNFGLRFEFLQATFYTETERVGTVGRMSADKQRWARVLGAHERAHVKILKQVLGGKASKKPFFNFRGVTESEVKFTKTAVAMEDLTVALLAGVAPRIQNREITAAVFGLLTTEARHAAWARHIAGFTPVVDAFDEPRPLRAVDRVVGDTHFVVAHPKVSSHRRRPRFTG
jgi:ferritin-like protein